METEENSESLARKITKIVVIVFTLIAIPLVWKYDLFESGFMSVLARLVIPSVLAILPIHIFDRAAKYKLVKPILGEVDGSIQSAFGSPESGFFALVFAAFAWLLLIPIGLGWSICMLVITVVQVVNELLERRRESVAEEAEDCPEEAEDCPREVKDNRADVIVFE